MLYLCRVKPLRHYLRGFLIAAWAGDKIAEFSFPEISFHFPLRPWFFFVSPAYAGKRACTPCCTPVCGDHPRMCGEKKKVQKMQAGPRGSPPHVRGKEVHVRRWQADSGITPAYAGKSEYRSFFPARPWDHPRVCGEKNGNYDTQACGGGSPPRMRGKDFWHYADNYATGITPAYAGKSAQLEGASPLAQDHPRVCGEKRDFSRLPPFLQGSPPRMRGKGERKRRHSNPRGITPAYAGKSSELSS